MIWRVGNFLKAVAWTSLGLSLASSPLVFSQSPVVVIPHFVNEWSHSHEGEGTVSSAVTLYSGTIGTYAHPGSSNVPVVPSAADSGFQLDESSLGQAFSSGVPFLNFETEILESAQAKLYPAQSATRDQVKGSTAAFRFKSLLYSKDGDGAVLLDPAMVDTSFGDPERAMFEEASELLRMGLRFAPYDRGLRQAFLEAHYDLALAEMQFVKQRYASLAKVRLELVAVPEGGFIVDEEIAVYEGILEELEGAIRAYGDLLGLTNGVKVADIDSKAEVGIPFGTYIFVGEQPYRNQYTASYAGETGQSSVPSYDPELEAVVENEADRTLFNGYKDYVMIAKLLSEYGGSASDLARLYGMRGAANDKEKALELIGRTQRELSVSTKALRTLFKGYEPTPGDASGLASALNGVKVVLSNLAQAEAFVLGTVNSLGFDPDFLVLIQEFPDQNSGNQFDSYDALVNWIRHTSVSPLSFAETTYDRARDSYDAYRGHADHLFEQLAGLASAHSDRYFKITGYEPSEDGDHIAEPASGSELWQVNRNIERANAKAGDLMQLQGTIDTGLGMAANAVESAAALGDSINDSLGKYRSAITEQRDTITHWNSVAAGSQASYETISDVASMSGVDDLLFGPWAAPVTGIAGIVNVGIQVGAQNNIGNAEKALDLASATFEAELEINDSKIALDQARIAENELQRELVSSTLEINDNKSLLVQENGRRAILVKELERIRQELDDNKGSLHDRYFADPVHYLRNQRDMVTADNAFREAQKWIFYTVRALEFKWNKDFVINYLDRDWETSTLLKLRNFRELEQMVAAMEQFNTVNLVGFNRESFVDRISLREVLAPYPGQGADSGERYDLVTGEVVTPVELMRRELKRNADSEGNIIVRLDTFAMDRDDGFFFLGPEYRADGSVLSAGKYLDKIEWVKLNAVSSEPTSVKSVVLGYGGTCYIRNRVPPCYTSDDPFSLSGEYRRFPFRYFFTLDNGASWQSRPSQEDTVKLVISDESGEPEKGVADSTLENTFLKERSVATTNLILTIPNGTLDIDALDDLEIYVSHLFVSRVIPDCE